MFIIALPLVAHADYQAGLDAYGSGDYDRAFYEWMQVADSPDGDVHPELLAETYYALGMLFWVGQGVQQNTAESALWLRKAAELNHPGAQVKLGYLYSSGEGVPQSDFEAMKWLMMAARQGDADAQYNLGVVYRDGLGVEADADKSVHWFREAAANGDLVSAGIVADLESVAADVIPDEPVGGRVAADPSRASALLRDDPVGDSRASALLRDDPVGDSRASALLQTTAPVNPESPWWVDVHRSALDERVGGRVAADVVPNEPVGGRVAADATDDSRASALLRDGAVGGRVAADPVGESRASAPPQTSAPLSDEPVGGRVAADATDEDWLRGREPEHYTIQVIALLDVQKLHAFIQRHPDWAPFALYEQKWKGQPLWVLVQGDYPDVIQAREAARKFPTDIQQRDKLWIRKFVMVQGLLE